jgi:O-antigen/teichoic acid export membrane protein
MSDLVESDPSMKSVVNHEITRPANPSVERKVASLLTAFQGRGNVVCSVLGNIIYAICQWGLLIVLTKTSTPTLVGQFALCLAIANPVVQFFNLNLRAVLTTDVGNRFRFADYLLLRIYGTVLGIFVVAAIAWLSGYRDVMLVLLIAVGIEKSVESTADLFWGLFQKHQRMDYFALSQLLKGPFALLAFGVTVSLTGSLLASVCWMAGIWIVSIFVFDVPCAARLLGDRTEMSVVGGIETKALLQLAWLSLPLGLVTLLLALEANIPRYFLEHFTSPEELGIFSALMFFTNAGLIFATAFGQSMLASLSMQYAAHNLRGFQKSLRRLALGGVIAGFGSVLIAVIFGKSILSIVYSPAYANHTALFNWLMLAGAINILASLLGYVITAMRLFRTTLIGHLITTAVTLAASWMLVRTQGLDGAGWTALVTVAVLCAFYYGSIHYVLNRRKSEVLSS